MKKKHQALKFIVIPLIVLISGFLLYQYLIGEKLDIGDSAYHKNRVGDYFISHSSCDICLTYEKITVDKKTFYVFPENGIYAIDKNHVYYDGKIVPEADVNTFEIIKFGWPKDQNHVFTGTKVLNADVETFVPLSVNYAKDKNNTYSTSETLKEEMSRSYIPMPNDSIPLSFVSIDENRRYFIIQDQSATYAKCLDVTRFYKIDNRTVINYK
jgi:hypothetical protein